MVSAVLARLAGENQQSAFGVSVDFACVRKAGVAQDRLRGVLEAIGCEPCLGEDMTFGIAGNSFRISFRLPGLAVVIQVIRPKTLQSHVWPPGVVPAFEFSAQERQVVKSLDDRNVLKPFVLERLDNSFGYSDGSVFPYGSEAGFDAPWSQ